MAMHGINVPRLRMRPVFGGFGLAHCRCAALPAVGFFCASAGGVKSWHSLQGLGPKNWRLLLRFYNVFAMFSSCRVGLLDRHPERI